MNEFITQKLEMIISGHKINDDDADWLRSLNRPVDQKYLEALRECQKVNSVILSEGGTNFNLWFDDVILAQQKLARALRKIDNENRNG